MTWSLPSCWLALLISLKLCGLTVWTWVSYNSHTAQWKPNLILELCLTCESACSESATVTSDPASCSIPWVRILHFRGVLKCGKVILLIIKCSKRPLIHSSLRDRPALATIRGGRNVIFVYHYRRSLPTGSLGPVRVHHISLELLRIPIHLLHKSLMLIELFLCEIHIYNLELNETTSKFKFSTSFLA